MASSIAVKGISAGYGSVQVLHDVAVTANDGETVVLLGSNGNGKSTLLKCIMGIITPSAGQVTFTVDGKPIDLIGKKPEEIVDLGVALVPEGRRLFPSLSVEENLILGAFRATARTNISQNLEFVFEAFPALASRRAQTAGSMSGGEQQMVAVARAFMSDPTLLLIDEPSVGLAPILVSRMIAKIKEFVLRLETPFCGIDLDTRGDQLRPRRCKCIDCCIDFLADRDLTLRLRRDELQPLQAGPLV